MSQLGVGVRETLLELPGLNSWNFGAFLLCDLGEANNNSDKAEETSRERPGMLLDDFTLYRRDPTVQVLASNVNSAQVEKPWK